VTLHEQSATRATPRVPATATTPPQHGAAPARARWAWRVVALPDEHGGWSLSANPALLGLLVAPSWTRGRGGDGDGGCAPCDDFGSDIEGGHMTTIDRDTTLAEVVTAHPRLARELERRGLHIRKMARLLERDSDTT
jgi:hypothetical protein